MTTTKFRSNYRLREVLPRAALPKGLGLIVACPLCDRWLSPWGGGGGVTDLSVHSLVWKHRLIAHPAYLEPSKSPVIQVWGNLC